MTQSAAAKKNGTKGIVFFVAMQTSQSHGACLTTKPLRKAKYLEFEWIARVFPIARAFLVAGLQIIKDYYRLFVDCYRLFVDCYRLS